MANKMNLTARLKDLASYLPESVLKNEELEALYPGWSASKILEKTGIAKRHIAADTQTAADLGVQAAKNLFAQGKVRPEDVDFLIFCSQAPDYILPTTACLIQERLGLPTQIGAIDVNLGCSGFVYGLSLAKGMIESGSAKCVLLITADTYSKYIHPLDKSVRTLFGDAAAASAIVGEESSESAIGPFVFGTDGKGAGNLIVEAGGFRTPSSSQTSVESTDESGNVRSRQNLYMNGAEVMAFSLKEVPRAIDALIEKSGMDKGKIDHFVLHQANRFMLEALQRKLKIEKEKLPICMEAVGNTVSSTIPLALLHLRSQGYLESPKKLMLVGFGVGYSWAACLLNL